MRNDRFHRIFKKGSKTYFYNSIFFPKEVRDDVFILYSFVRIADNFVDAIPQEKDSFCNFFEDFCRAWDGDRTGDEVLDSFVNMAKRRDFEKEWIEAFLNSMEMDLVKSSYRNINEVEEYIYGSAEVVGLMMSNILSIDRKFHVNARYLGKAMQYINFIRDINEDVQLGRTYLPLDELNRAGLESLDYGHVKKNEESFKVFIREQLDRYRNWQSTASEGFSAIDKRYRVPIMNASDMYNWTGEMIRKDPMIIYRKKVKPSKLRIIGNFIHKKISL